ncbi:MAG: DNA-methyltransferase (dcm) [Promethearchaeota archaeon CR_4]|nr:MAG: DNA-methyltransferase (dcm) [Candidatus Lokiarchaeota archaeon CR_4]
MGKTYTAIDLFCGAGGFSRGFEGAGIDVVAAYDWEEKFKDTFNRNHTHPVFATADISAGISGKFTSGSIDIVFGSPPCQGFSDARGNRDPKNADQFLRNTLPIAFVNVVNQVRPKVALMENVAGMATYRVKDGLFIDKLREKFADIGYDMTYQILNGAQFGVPQERHRVFCLAIEQDFKVAPQLIHHDIAGAFSSPTKYVTVGDAISDLPRNPVGAGETCEYGVLLENATAYQQIMRADNPNGTIQNHQIVAKPTEAELQILRRLPEGKIYRSSRFGDRYVGVWELFADLLAEDERQLLYFLCQKRTNTQFKEWNDTRYNEGFIRELKFSRDTQGRFMYPEQFPAKEPNPNRPPQVILDSLVTKGWLRTKQFRDSTSGEGFVAYDINSIAGVRPMYMRLTRLAPARTIMTTSFKVKELVHPTEPRPLTLREGCRIQSFPDTFIFPDSKKYAPTIIGNAVPPLMAQELGKYLRLLLYYLEDSRDTYYLDIIRRQCVTSKKLRKKSPTIAPVVTLLNFLPRNK